MFCSECGNKLASGVKFCSGCGTGVGETSTPNNKAGNFDVNAEATMSLGEFLIEVFPDLIPMVRQTVPEMLDEGYFASFLAQSEAMDTKTDFIFVLRNDMLLIKAKGMLSYKPLELTRIKREDLSRIELGSAHHTSHGGFVSSDYEYVTLTIFLTDGSEFHRYVEIARGDAGNQARQWFSQDISNTAALFPVYDSGNHEESAGGWTTSFGFGVWRDA